MKTEMRWFVKRWVTMPGSEVTVLQYRTFDPALYIRRLSQTVEEANEACWSEWKDVPTVRE